MKRRAAVGSTLLTVVLACILLSGPAPADTASHPSKHMDAALSQVLSNAVDRHDTPGAVGLVVDRNGTLFAGAAGNLDLARKTALRPDAIFNIASMTKPVTSVAIMMLQEQGKLSIDDPVSKYLPGFDHLQVITKFNEADGTYEAHPATTVMTLRHLLTHTSGIGYAFSSPLLARLQAGSQKAEWEFPLLHEPGERWTYGASTRVLGLIVEKLSGESLEQYFQEHVFIPLGMVDTSFAVPTAKQPRVITTYSHVNGEFVEQHPQGMPSGIPSVPTPPFRGDGGLYSTASDYGLFMRMLLNGGRLGRTRLLSERSVHAMSENHIGEVFVSTQPVGLPALTKPFPLGAGRDKFGLGFQIAAENPGTEYRRAGSLSWAGLFNTEFWVDPKTGIGGVLLMQYLPFYDDGAIRTLQNFEATVYRELGVP